MFKGAEMSNLVSQSECWRLGCRNPQRQGLGEAGRILGRGGLGYARVMGPCQCLQGLRDLSSVAGCTIFPPYPLAQVINLIKRERSRFYISSSTA